MKTATASLVCVLLLALPLQAAAPSPRLQGIGAMPGPRAAHSATRLADGRVLIAGGCRSDGCEEGLAEDVLLFDPANGHFETTGALRNARAGHRAVALQDGTVLVIGGWTQTGVTDSIERYHPASGRFEPFARLRVARDGFSATVLADGTILVAGGYTDGMRRLASAERFDPRTRRSTPVADMRSPRMSHTATRLADGRVLVAGGSDSRDSVTATLEVFDPASAGFSPAGTLRKARHKHAAIRIGDEVLIIGGAGIPESTGHYTETEVWTAAAGNTAPGPHLREGRYKFLDSVVPLPAGRVLVAGGGTHAEILSPDRSAFRQIARPIGKRLAFATATPLADGRVLVLGGYDPDIRVSNGAWVLE